MFRWRSAWAVGCKEMRDLVRDRRTIFMAVVFPLILYPLLIIGIIQATLVQETRAEARIITVAVSGAEHAAEVVSLIDDHDHLRVAEYVEQEGRFGARDASAAVLFPEDFLQKLTDGKTAGVVIFYDSADPDSQTAMRRVAEILDGIDARVRDRRLEQKGLDAEYIDPLTLEAIDVATPRQRGAFHVGRILAFLLVVLCLMGALYPALDAISGEKERGTLETLLSIPATRLEILGGKYMAVFGMSMTSALSNLVSLSVTFFMVSLLLRASPPTDSPIDLTVPLSAFFLFLPALLPLAAFFSAVTLGVASFARSTREGQYYLGPLYAAVLPITALALSPAVRLGWFGALVPVLSTALFIKEGLLGTLPAGPAVVSLAATCLWAAAALVWAGRVFSREEVLFSSPVREEEPVAGGAPLPGHVLFVWAISVILFFFVGLPLREIYSPVSPVLGIIVYGGFVGGPAFLYCLLWRIDWRSLFVLGALSARRVTAALLLVPGVILLAMSAKALQMWLLAPPRHVMGEAALEQVAVWSIWAVLFTMALLPAVFEELLYRGFIYRSLAMRLGPGVAVILSALLFCVAHLNIYDVVPLLVLGVILALLVRETKSLETAMIVHFANNAFSMLVLMGYIDIGLFRVEVHGVWLGVFIVGAAAAGLLLTRSALAVARAWLWQK